MRLPEVVGRYVLPAKGVAPTAATARRVASVAWSAYRRDDVATSLPAALGLDVSDACNIACTVCSREIARDPRRSPFLPLARFVQVVDEVRPAYLLLSGYGETLLNRELASMVAHATAVGSRVTVVSNGTLLDGDRARALLDAGLAKLKVSLDGATPDVYARHRQGADLDKVLHNVDRLLAMRDALRSPGPAVEPQMVLFRDNLDQAVPLLELCRARWPGVEPNFLPMYTYGDQAGFVDLALPVGDAAARATVSVAGGRARALGMWRAAASLDAIAAQMDPARRVGACAVPWWSAIVSTDGELSPCCHHTVRGASVGNVFARPFAEVWNGEAMRAFRRRLREDRCADRVCASCRQDDAPLEGVFERVGKVVGGRGAPATAR